MFLVDCFGIFLVREALREDDQVVIHDLMLNNIRNEGHSHDFGNFIHVSVIDCFKDGLLHKSVDLH